MKGFTQVPHNFFKWLFTLNLTGLEIKIILFVLQKTVGWGKESDKISLSQFEKEMGVTRRGITKTIKRLVNSGTLVRTKGKINSYRLGNAGTLALGNWKVQGRELEGTKLGNAGSHTKEYTKETIQKGFKVVIKNGQPVAVLE